MPPLVGDTDRYYLSANNDNEWQGEVIVGARDEAIMIDWINDLNGNKMWRNQTLWEIETPIPSYVLRNNIKVGHHKDFVTIKSENQGYLHIVSLCGNEEKFNPETNLCVACNNDYKSLGFQDEDCNPCGKLRNFGRSNDINMATYSRMCAFSEIQTGWVLIITILTCAVVGFLFVAAPQLSAKKEKVSKVVTPAESLEDKEEASIEMVSERQPIMTKAEAPEDRAPETNR